MLKILKPNNTVQQDCWFKKNDQISDIMLEFKTADSALIVLLRYDLTEKFISYNEAKYLGQSQF